MFYLTRTPTLFPALVAGPRTQKAFASGVEKLSSVFNSGDYLARCKTQESSLQSTVFRGTLYEYTSKDFLESNLKCFDIIRKGGAFDNGIDLVGKWDLYHFFKLNETELKSTKMLKTKAKVLPIIENSKEFHQLKNTKTNKNSISIRSDVNVLVQCKNHSTKIKASIIRELVGIYLHQIPTEIQRNSTFMILVSPGPLTKQAQSIIDQTSIPLIHIILSPLVLGEKKGKRFDIYDLKNWRGGEVSSIYLNSYSRILLKYLNIDLEFQKLKEFILLGEA